MTSLAVVQLLLSATSASALPDASQELELINPRQSSTWHGSADRAPLYAEDPLIYTEDAGEPNYEKYYTETTDWAHLTPSPCAATTADDETPFAWWHADLKDPRYDGAKETW